MLEFIMPTSVPRASASTARLLQLCAGYFVSYVLTGVLVKYFTGVRQPKLTELAYLFNNTLGSSIVCLGIVLALGWAVRLAATSNRMVQRGPFRVPAEVAYIVPSGVCTAIVIPTTTLMYSLPISVMVAMVLMRASVIVISRVVDEVQIRQGILTKRVFAEENWAVVFALLAVATNLLLLPLAAALEHRGVVVPKWLGITGSAARGAFDFLHDPTAMTILGAYIVAYAARIYIMNFYKNTRGKGVPLDNRGFFAVEQISASVTMVAIGALVVLGPRLFGWSDPRVVEFSRAAAHPDATALVAGIPYAAVAFFSVFIFMFEGRTATFAGLVNRLTSLLAGTTATLVLWLAFGMRFPTAQDWVSVAFILVAVGFLSVAERRRTAEKTSERAVPPLVDPRLAPSPMG
jgi:hypothetical protein